MNRVHFIQSTSCVVSASVAAIEKEIEESVFPINYIESEISWICLDPFNKCGMWVCTQNCSWVPERALLTQKQSIAVQCTMI